MISAFCTGVGERCIACGESIDGQVWEPVFPMKETPKGTYHPSCLELLDLERGLRRYIAQFSRSVQPPTMARVALATNALTTLGSTSRDEAFRQSLRSLIEMEEATETTTAPGTFPIRV